MTPCPCCGKAECGTKTLIDEMRAADPAKPEIRRIGVAWEEHGIPHVQGWWWEGGRQDDYRQDSDPCRAYCGYTLEELRAISSLAWSRGHRMPRPKTQEAQP